MEHLISLDAQLEAQTVGDRVDILAESLLEMECELEALELAVKNRRAQLLEAMDAVGLSSIKSKAGNRLTVVETQRYNIDSDIAKQIIDAQTPEVQDRLLKVNDSEFRKLFPTSEAVSLAKKTRSIKITKG